MVVLLYTLLGERARGDMIFMGRKMNICER